MVDFLLFLAFFLVLELSYLAIAKRYNISDKPNFRSSHQNITIRGGGIIFPIAMLIFHLIDTKYDIAFFISLSLISITSFIDDVKDVKSFTRLVIQSLSVLGLLYSLNSSVEIFYLAISFLIILGVINAYNFMDGINGMTVLYSLVSISTLFWISHNIEYLLPNNIFLSLIASLLVFAFFNLRNKAICFSGDVGSISIAFIICFFLMLIISQTRFLYWILFLGVYGIDTLFTIVCRAFRRESLFKAHRSHFYQYLVNEAGLKHLQVSLIYSVAQIILNVIVILSYLMGKNWPALTASFVFLIIYIIFRFRLEGRKRLFVSYNPD